jgi:hypothetical protein
MGTTNGFPDAMLALDGILLSPADAGTCLSASGTSHVGKVF